MSRPLRSLRCWLTRDAGDEAGGEQPHDVTIRDKHGIEHHAFNLQAELAFDDHTLALGLTPEEFGAGGQSPSPAEGASKSDAWRV